MDDQIYISVMAEPDGALKVVTRVKIIHYHQVYLNHPDAIVSCLSVLTLQTASTMTSVDFCFFKLIVKHRTWEMNYRRNRVNFDSFAPLV
jgi:hypothetical protein